MLNPREPDEQPRENQMSPRELGKMSRERRKQSRELDEQPRENQMKPRKLGKMSRKLSRNPREPMTQVLSYCVFMGGGTNLVPPLYFIKGLPFIPSHRVDCSISPASLSKRSSCPFPAMTWTPSGSSAAV